MNTYDENLFEPEKIQGLQPYLFEPECASQSSCDDARSHDFFEEDVESVVVDGMEAVRIGNKDWCTCINCKEERREIDSLCRNEVGAISLAVRFF